MTPLLHEYNTDSYRIHHHAIKRGDVLSEGRRRLRVEFIAKPQQTLGWRRGSYGWLFYRVAILEDMATHQRLTRIFTNSSIVSEVVVSGPSFDKARCTGHYPMRLISA